MEQTLFIYQPNNHPQIQPLPVLYDTGLVEAGNFTFANDQKFIFTTLDLEEVTMPPFL